MSHNVLKVAKQNSQPIPSTHQQPPVHTLHHLTHQISLDISKGRESVPLLKDTAQTTSQTGIKKLAFLLNPRKDRALTIQDLHSSMSPSYTSPKNLTENQTKLNKLKVSTSTQEKPNMNLISPKDLVRLAMSKHNKSKTNAKKVTPSTNTQSSNNSSMPRNFRKSLSLRFGPGLSTADKRDGSSKIITSTTEENSGLSRTTLGPQKEKSSKLKRMKLAYNDTTQPEMARLTRSTAYTPQEASGRFWQGSLSPNRSNSGLLWPGSPSGPTSGSHNKSRAQGNQQGGSTSKDREGGEKSHRKMSSVEPFGNYLKETKPVARQGKRQEKTMQARKNPSMENLKTNSVSFSRLMSHNTVNLDVDRAKSPGEAKGEDEIDETIHIPQDSDRKIIKPREEFIADLKSWVNEIVKPQEGKQAVAAAPKKNPVAAEKVKQAQEGLLEKLRDALENDEFVRRDDYERLYREKETIEEELDEVKEENAKLRAILWQIQKENEERQVREQMMREREEANLIRTLSVKSSYGGNSNEVEALMRQQKEIEALKRRENIVKEVMRMIWKAGIQIGDLQQQDEEMREYQEGEEERDDTHYMGEEDESYNDQQEHSLPMNVEHFKMNDKYIKNLQLQQQQKQQQANGENFYQEGEMYTYGIPEQKEEEIEESDATSRNPKALSELGDTENESSVLCSSSNNVKKPPSNTKSTADSSPLFSAKPVTPQSCLRPRGKSKLKLDFTAIRGTTPLPQSNAYSSQSSAEKFHNYIMTDGGQSLGFHEEFMSKLEEFSLSWRQAALNYQKF